MSELGKVVTKLKKTYGDHISQVGGEIEPVVRIPTGVFAFDLATGGGFPSGRVNLLYGAESSGKTTIALLLIAHVQRVFKQKAVFVDLENSLDLGWAQVCGVMIDELVILRPDTAEQVVNSIEAVLYAMDVGIVILDSIAAMATENEIQSEAEKVIVAGSALIVGKLVRKSVLAISAEKKRGHLVTLVLINQIRNKIGVMFGNPEVMPGGFAPKFASSMTVRLYGKDKIVKEISSALPAFKEVSAIVQKWKVPILAKAFEYELCLIPHGNLKLLDSPSWGTVSGFLKKHGALGKQGNHWVCMGTDFPTLGAIQQAYETNKDVKMALQQEVVRLELGAPSTGYDDDESVSESGQGE